MATPPAYSFTERSEIERGFARVFQDEIVPLLDRHEARRRKMKRKALKGMGVSGVAGAGGAGGSYGMGFADGLYLAPIFGGAG
ncbi:MAG: hypothetical protein OEN23_04030, partial [Paracoccaceae bacterium]|nr:hypothetical protein [Paracoccaceae bacterium]